MKDEPQLDWRTRPLLHQISGLKFQIKSLKQCVVEVLEILHLEVARKAPLILTTSSTYVIFKILHLSILFSLFGYYVFLNPNLRRRKRRGAEKRKTSSRRCSLWLFQNCFWLLRLPLNYVHVLRITPPPNRNISNAFRLVSLFLSSFFLSRLLVDLYLRTF